MKDFGVNPDQITLRLGLRLWLGGGTAIIRMRDVLPSILFNSNNCAASAAWVEVCALVSSFPVPFVLIVDKTQIIHNITTHSRYNNIHIILPDHPKKNPRLIPTSWPSAHSQVRETPATGLFFMLYTGSRIFIGVMFFLTSNHHITKHFKETKSKVNDVTEELEN